MTKFTLVEFGNPQGGGFVPYVDSRLSPPPAAFQTAAKKLTQSQVPQPTINAKDWHRYPMWSLRLVQVEGQHYWCFAVQGRGGAFGSAGTCQFIFASWNDLHPCDVWLAAAEAVGPDGRLVHPDLVQPTNDWLQDSKPDSFRVLDDLLDSAPTVVVAGRPIDVAATIQHVLALIPSSVAEGRIWATYLMRPPLRQELGTVTGRWPAGLPDPETGLDHWLDRTSGLRALYSHPKRERALTWLASRASLPGAYLTCESMDDLVRQISAQELTIELADIPALLDSNDERLLSGDLRDLVEEWVGQHPRATVTRLAAPDRHVPELAAVLFHALLDVHRQARPGENPALFPPDADQVPEWPDASARLLRNHFSQERLIDFVRNYLLAPGRPLHGPARYSKQERWLAAVGAPLDDPNLGLYAVPVPLIVREILTTKRLGANSRTFLLNANDRATRIMEIVVALRQVPTTVAVQLVDLLTGEQEIVKVIAAGMAAEDRATPGQRSADPWLCTVINNVPSDKRDPVIDAGVHYLRRTGQQMSNNLLAAVLRHQAEEPGRDLALGAVLTEAAGRLSAAGDPLAGKARRHSPTTGRKSNRVGRRGSSAAGGSRLIVSDPPRHQDFSDVTAPRSEPLDDSRYQEMISLLFALLCIVCVLIALVLLFTWTLHR